MRAIAPTVRRSTASASRFGSRHWPFQAVSRVWHHRPVAAGKRIALAASVLLVRCTLTHAQPPTCNAAPNPPDQLQSKVASSIKAASNAPYTPAVLRLSWTASDGDRDHPANAPVAYIIEAGSQRGLSDIARVQTAGPELTFATPMANGIYYVRVRSVNACGTSGPSKESKVRVRDSVKEGEPNPLVLISTVHGTQERFGNKAYVRVTGQVRNGWKAAPAVFVRVTARFEGSNGELGVSGGTYVNGTARRLKRSRLVTDTILEPGATGCFLIFAEFPKPEVTGVGLWAVADLFDTEPLKGRIEVDSSLVPKSDAFDDLVVSGRMKNTGNRQTGLNEIWVEARDDGGHVLDCHAASLGGSNLTLDDGLTTRTGLQPAQSAEFENGTEAVFSMAHTFRSWITWDEADDRATPALTPRYRMLKKELIALLEGDEHVVSPQEIAKARDGLRDETRSIEAGLTTAAHR